MSVFKLILILEARDTVSVAFNQKIELMALTMHQPKSLGIRNVMWWSMLGLYISCVDSPRCMLWVKFLAICRCLSWSEFWRWEIQCLLPSKRLGQWQKPCMSTSPSTLQTLCDVRCLCVCISCVDSPRCIPWAKFLVVLWCLSWS